MADRFHVGKKYKRNSQKSLKQRKGCVKINTRDMPFKSTVYYIPCSRVRAGARDHKEVRET